MTLVAGTRFGAYDVVALLGTGGMGEVYRARDTRLKREVALKILPASFAADPDRLVRFQREAEVLASLDHPHIGAIYGIEESDGIRALVLQLVEGETLADRIARGPVSVDDAMPIARQVAEALEAAHERGVIHRDLKPANVKITPDGVVKVLDFGLAKLIEPGSGIRDSGSEAHIHSQSPTITTPALMTGVGTLLGTAAYMSPEQAKGHPADKRSDIWAFGCVLFEMLTGKRAFDGDDVAETLAAVIRGEPDWAALPHGVPSSLVALVKGCVRKDRRQRIGDMAAALFVLRDSSIGGSTIGSSSAAKVPAPSRWRRTASHLVVAAAVVTVTSAIWWTRRPSVEQPLVTRFAITLPDDQRLPPTVTSVVAISRDGTKVAYTTIGSIFVRPLSDSEAKAILITGVDNVLNPVFSPDGKSIVFYSPRDRTLRKIAVTGGPAVKLCDVADLPSGISWDAGGIVFGQGIHGILRVSEDGGKPDVLAAVQPGELAAAPHILPDGDSLLFTLAPAESGRETWTWDQARIVLQSLKSGQRTTLVEGGSDARYIASGHLVYAVGGVLFARPFGLRQLQFTGGSVPVVVDGIRRGSGNAMVQNTRLFNAVQFDVSENGSLVYVPGIASPSALRMELVLTDRDGGLVPLKLPPGPYQSPRTSLDAKQVAYGTDDGKEAIVWIYDLGSTTSPRRLTFEGRNRFPVWSGDGQWVAFQSDRDGDLGVFRQRADGTTGTAERLTKPDAGTSHAPESWSPDGHTLLFTVTKGPEVLLQMLSLPDRKIGPYPGVQTTVWPNTVFSPDGRMVAYSMRRPDQTRNTLYVEPFPPTGAKHQVASGDAHMPVWSRDGRELFFIDPRSAVDGRLGFVRVTVDTRTGFAVREPVQVPRQFNVTTPGIGRPRTFDILADGRFVGIADEAQPGKPAVPHIEVVVNWFEELKQRVPLK